MTVILDEHFNAGSTDWSKWNLNGYDWAPHQPNPGNPSETQAYDAAQVVQNPTGSVSLVAEHKPYTVNGVTYPYTSGMMHTRSKIYGTYASVQVQAKLPIGAGMWPAIWMLPQDESWPPEIDILEAWGNSSKVTHNLIYSGGQTGPTDVALDPTVYHTYGIEWTPSYVRFLVDYAEVQKITSHVPSVPMYLLINLAIEGGKVTNPALFPAKVNVSNVRITQP